MESIISELNVITAKEPIRDDVCMNFNTKRSRKEVGDEISFVPELNVRSPISSKIQFASCNVHKITIERFNYTNRP